RPARTAPTTSRSPPNPATCSPSGTRRTGRTARASSSPFLDRPAGLGARGWAARPRARTTPRATERSAEGGFNPALTRAGSEPGAGSGHRAQDAAAVAAVVDQGGSTPRGGRVGEERVFVHLAEQIVVGGLRDGHPHELTGGDGFAREVDAAVDLRRLASMAADEHELALFARAFHQHLELLAHERSVLPLADAALQAHELLGARLRHARRHLAVELVGGGFRLVGVLEHAHPLELRPLDEVAQLGELLLRLPRVPHDERRAEGDIGDGGAEPLHQVAEPVSAVAATHP